MFGDVIRSHRRRLGLSQEELAARAGISVRGLRKIEANRTSSPRITTVRRLSEALDLTTDERQRLIEDSTADATAGAGATAGTDNTGAWDATGTGTGTGTGTAGNTAAAGAGNTATAGTGTAGAGNTATTDAGTAATGNTATGNTATTDAGTTGAGNTATTDAGTTGTAAAVHTAASASAAGAAARPASRRARRPGPVQLPADVAGFTGREEHVRRLTALSDDYRAHHPTAVMIAVITGSAGIGKTALAVHWAHLARRRFPDGQLYVNLRGFDPNDAAVRPSDAILRFLDALEVPQSRIPESPDAQAALYRSMLADRRVLILLDNAADAEQVRPLLPGAAGCLVVVTSRNHLSGLVAADGAHLVALDLLSTAEARRLLDARLGQRRTDAEPAATDEIVSRCARLPLALVIAAARAAAHPQFALHELAAELRERRGRLDALAGDDPETDVRTVFSWSYRAVTPQAARLLRLLGLHPGPDISLPAAASLAGVPAHQTRSALVELARAHLIVEHQPGRYTLHDLLRVYAAEQSVAVDPPAQRHAAIHRLLDHYLHSLDEAVRCLRRRPYAPRLEPPHPGVAPERHAGYEAALEWRDRESAVLLAAIQHAAASEFVTHAWQMTLRFVAFIEHCPHRHDWIVPCRAVLAAAQRVGDQVGQAHAHHDLARVYAVWYRYDEAATHLRHSLELFRRLRDDLGQAHAHEGLTWVMVTMGELSASRDHAQRSLELYRACADVPGEANALNNVGWANIQLGEYRQAVIECRRSVELSESLDIPSCAAYAWDSLGCAHQHLGEYDTAIECYRHALELCRSLFQRGATFCRLGEVQRITGDLESAREAYRSALVILTELGHPDAEQARVELEAVELEAAERKAAERKAVEHEAAALARRGRGRGR